MLSVIITYIRKKILLYIFFVNIYKKTSNLFSFVEGYKYKFIKNSKITHIIEVGCNDFQITKILFKMKKEIRVTCFDPKKNKIRIKNVIFYNHALSNVNIKGKLFIPYYKGFELSSLSSLMKQSLYNYFKKNKIDIKKIKIKEKNITIRKLDNKNFIFQFFKIDAEGSELQIIKGALSNIKKNNPVILLEKNKDLYKIEKILKKLKYEKFYYKKNFHKLTNTTNKFEDIFFLNKESFKYL